MDSDLAALKASAEDAYSKTETLPPATAAADPQWWSTQNAMTMCSVVLLFGLCVLLLATYLVRKGSTGASVLRIFGTILVVVMATFLVVAGYDNAQLGAPLGLLGTIAGYLLGKDAHAETNRPPGSGSDITGA